MSRGRAPALSAGLAAVLFAAVALAVTYVWDASGRQVTDFELYRTYGEAMAAGDVPYRDFAFEYPPLALPALALPALVTGGETSYEVAFAMLMAACGALAILLTGRSLQVLGRSGLERDWALSLLVLSPLVLGPVLLTRFDLVPALAVAGATLAVLSGRERTAAVVLGLGVAAKLWPAILLPVLAVVTWRRHGRREATLVSGTTLALALAVYLPFLAVAPGGVVDSVTRQLGRPLQIESIGSGALLALHHLAGMPLEWASSRGSQNLTGLAADSLAVGLGIAQVAVVLLVVAAFARGPASPERLVLASAAAIVGVVALGRVLSPQFLVWPLFALALVGGTRGRIATVLYAAACALTLGWFPARYWELVREFDPVGSALVAARGLVLVALLAILLWPARSAVGRARG